MKNHTTEQWAKWTAYGKALMRDQRREALLVLGNKCAWCGYDDFRALQIDHINGFKGEKRNTYRVYKAIAERRTEGYQLLCANCNWIKRWERNENPCQGDRPGPRRGLVWRDMMSRLQASFNG